MADPTTAARVSPTPRFWRISGSLRKISGAWARSEPAAAVDASGLRRPAPIYGESNNGQPWSCLDVLALLRRFRRNDCGVKA
jgi:hypothetical protein